MKSTNWVFNGVLALAIVILYVLHFYGVDHFADVLVPNSIFLDFGHRNLKDSLNAAVQEDFELVKLGLAQGPCFGSP